MNNKFTEREKSFEKKFQMDQELQFKVQARSCKYLAEFVSSKLVKTEEEWLEALETLIKDPSLRRSLGIEARKTVEKNYSLNAIEHQYLKILNKQINDK